MWPAPFCRGHGGKLNQFICIWTVPTGSDRNLEYYLPRLHLLDSKGDYVPYICYRYWLWGVVSSSKKRKGRRDVATNAQSGVFQINLKNWQKPVKAFILSKSYFNTIYFSTALTKNEDDVEWLFVPVYTSTTATSFDVERYKCIR